MNSIPTWMPPLSFQTIATAVLIIAATQADKLPNQLTRFIVHPLGFVLLSLIAISSFEYGAAPFSVALILLLLSVWAAKKTSRDLTSEYSNKTFAPFGLHENFTTYSPSGTIDWVTEPKKWFVERVLKENPLAIVAKDVQTYPVQTESSSSNA